jgi:addiction module RelE/StbE family toxin
MIALQAKSFQKSVRRLSQSIVNALSDRLELFFQDPFHPTLHNHALFGRYANCRSINITGDYRLIYENIDKDTVRFLDIDTHHNLYGN